MPVIEAASVWLRSALVVRSTNRRSSSARIRAGEIVDMFHGVAPDALANDLGGVVHALRPGQFVRRAEFLDPLVVERHDLVESRL